MEYQFLMKSITPLQFTSETEIFDIQIDNQETYQLPASSIEDAVSILYAFQGEVMVNEDIILSKGESRIIDNEEITLFTSDQVE